MSSEALESQGVELQLSDDASPEVFTKIAETVDINQATGQAAVIPTTDLSSTAIEKRMGLPDEGQCTLTINYIPTNAQHSALKAARAARTRKHFKLYYTDSPQTIDTFFAYVLSLPRTIAVDGIITSSITLEIDGPVT